MRPLVLALLALPVPAAAATVPSIWGIVNAQVGLDAAAPGMRVWFDAQARRNDAGEQFVVRPGLGWQVAPWATVHAGYAWVPTVYDDADRATKTEHRAWEQLVLHPAVHDAVKLVIRTRVEHRFFDATPGIGVRLRELVRVNWAPPALGPVGLVLTEEVLVGTHDVPGVQVAGFDQNRAFAGVALGFGKGLGRVETGYQNNLALRDGEVSLDHILQVAVHVRPKARRPAPVDEGVADAALPAAEGESR